MIGRAPETVGLHILGIENISKHNGVCAPMMSLCGGHIDLLGGLPREMQLRPDSVLARTGPFTAKDAVHFDMFVDQLALGALKTDFQTFPRRIGGQRVIRTRPRGIGDMGLHGVLDPDLFVKDTQIAEIAVLVLGLAVERTKRGIRVHIQFKVAFIRNFAGGAARTATF